MRHSVEPSIRVHQLRAPEPISRSRQQSRYGLDENRFQRFVPITPLNYIAASREPSPLPGAR
jgi:hypothetical protein